MTSLDLIDNPALRSSSFLTICSSSACFSQPSSAHCIFPATFLSLTAQFLQKKTKRRKRKKRNSPQNSLTLNLHIRPQRQLLYRHTRSRGLHVAPIRLVHVVHRGEMLHFGEEDVDFEDGVEAGAGGGEDGGEVADALVLLLRVRILDMCLFLFYWCFALWCAFGMGSVGLESWIGSLRCGLRRCREPFCRFWGRCLRRRSSRLCCWL